MQGVGPGTNVVRIGEQLGGLSNESIIRIEISSPHGSSGSTADTDVRVREFIRSVYAWMFGGLLITTAAALWVLYSPAMQAIVLQNRMVFFGLLIAEFGAGDVAAGAHHEDVARRPRRRRSSSISLLNGLTLSVIFFVYTQAAIFQAFLSAALMFGAMSVFGYVTKRDLTSMGSFLIMGF